MLGVHHGMSKAYQTHVYHWMGESCQTAHGSTVGDSHQLDKTRECKQPDKL